MFQHDVEMKNTTAITTNLNQAEDQEMNFDIEDFMRCQPLADNSEHSIKEPEISKDCIPENSWNQVVNSMDN